MASSHDLVSNGDEAPSGYLKARDAKRARSEVLVGLQYLRAIAAAGVLVFHAAQRAGLPFWVGEAGVDLFFLLSGFLMLAITDPSSKPGAFLGSRLRRIVPPYWIATSVLLAGGVAGLFPQMQLVPWHVLSSYLFIPASLRSASHGRCWWLDGRSTSRCFSICPLR